MWYMGAYAGVGTCLGHYGYMLSYACRMAAEKGIPQTPDSIISKVDISKLDISK